MGCCECVNSESKNTVLIDHRKKRTCSATEVVNMDEITKDEESRKILEQRLQQVNHSDSQRLKSMMV